MDRGKRKTSGVAKGLGNTAKININIKGSKEIMCIMDIDMDEAGFIARKIGAFYNRRTGNYIADTPLVRRAYVKKSQQYELPLNLKYVGGRFSSTTDKARITLSFERTKKNKDYVVRAHGQVANKTFAYANEDELRDKVKGYLEELNADYDPELQYASPNDNASEWWLSSALQSRALLASRAGYSADYTDPFGDFAQNFLPDSDGEDEEEFVAPFGFANKFGAKGALRYMGLNVYDDDFKPNTDRCGWEYLIWTMGFDKTRITDIKGNSEDFWTMEELMNVAKYYNRNMGVYDLQGDKLRYYTSPTNYTDTYFDVVPTSENHKRHMVFTIANGHIYPYTSKVQYALLHSSRTTKIDKYNGLGQITKDKSIIHQAEVDRKVKGKAKAQEELNDYIRDNEDIQYYEEGHLNLGELAIHSKIITEDEDLTPLLLGMIEKGNEVPNIISKDGIITKLFACEWNEEEKKFKELWYVKSCPNMGIVKPILEEIGFMYVGQDITNVGSLIYNRILGCDTNGLKSTTLGSIFTPETAFNATTKTAVEEEQKSAYGNDDRDYYNEERFDRTLALIANSLPIVMAKKASDENRWKKAQLNTLKFMEQARGTAVAPTYEEHGDLYPPTAPPPPKYVETIDPLKQKAIDLGFIDEDSVPISGMEEAYTEWLMIEEECPYLTEVNDNLDDIRFQNENEADQMEEVDLSHLGEYVSIDIRKCYTSCLENPANPFMRFEVFDNVVDFHLRDFDNELGWYFVSFINPAIGDNEHEFFPFVGVRNGWFCLKVIQLALGVKGLDFEVSSFIAPHRKNVLGRVNKKDEWGNWYKSADNHFTEFVNYVYDKLGSKCVCSRGCDGGCAPKFVVNSFIGQLGMYHREKGFSKSFVVSTTDDEKYYSLKGLETYIIRSGDNPLFLMVEKHYRDYKTDALSIHSQILQEAKCMLYELNSSIKFVKVEEQIIEEKCGEPESWITWKFSRGRKLPFKDEKFMRTAYDNYCKSLVKKVCRSETIELCCPLMYKTDSILLADYGSGRLNEALANVPFGADRGMVREEFRGRGKVKEGKDSVLIASLFKRFTIKQRDTELDELQTKKWVKHEKEEYEKLLDRGEGFRLDGMAGTGKSSLTCGGHGLKGVVEYLKETGKTYVLTATTHKAKANKLFVEKGYIGSTIHSFLKCCPVPLDPKFSMCEGLDYLIIDECSMLNKIFYLHLRNIKTLYPSLSIIMIGDYQQLPSVESNAPTFVNYEDMENTQLVKWLCDFNLIHLTENKRCSEEGELMFKLYNDIVKGKLDKDDKAVLKSFVKHERFNPYDAFLAGGNLCWKNATKDYINLVLVEKMFFNNRGDKEWDCSENFEIEGKVIKARYMTKIWVKRPDTGDANCKVVSTKNMNREDNAFYNNQEFYITAIAGWDEIQLTDTITGDDIVVNREEIYRYFDYAYATTIHRAQGSTITAPYSINDWNDRLSKKLKYVAVSRTSDKENIQINPRWEHRIPVIKTKNTWELDRKSMIETLKEGGWFPKKK